MNDLHLTDNKYYIEGDFYYIILNIPKDIPFDISTIIVKYRRFSDANDKSYKQRYDVSILNSQIPQDIKETMVSYFVEIKSYIKILETNLELCLCRKNVDTNYFTICTKDINLEIDDQSGDPYYSHVTNITIDQLNVIIRCNRCLAISTNTCRNCGPLYGVTFEPNTHNSEMGHIEFNDCKFVSYESYSLFVYTKCDSIVHTGTIDMRYDSKCKCGEQIVINALDFRITDNTQQQVCQKKSVQNKKINSSYVTSKDGTCKHYKRSFKFYIFPCCNAKFECDICHDAKMDHKAQRADKMLCGICYKLQNVGICCEQKQNGHWNNGKGCRNKVTMNRKDSKKYKG